MPRAQRGLTVHKFGGASLADAKAMKNAIALVRGTPGPGVVVVSALAGVTDALLEAAGAVGRKPEGRIEEIAPRSSRSGTDGASRGVPPERSATPCGEIRRASGACALSRPRSSSRT
jgi:aspartokinase